MNKTDPRRHDNGYHSILRRRSVSDGLRGGARESLNIATIITTNSLLGIYLGFKIPFNVIQRCHLALLLVFTHHARCQAPSLARPAPERWGGSHAAPLSANLWIR